MPYLKVKDCADCNYLAELVVRRGGDYYTSAERLANQLKLRPRERLKLKSNLRRMIEGTYLGVRGGKK